MSTRVGVQAVLLRGASWPAIVALTLGAAVVGGGGVALVRPSGASTVLAVALALLAAASGFALDEPSAAVVDVAPMPLAHWTAGRALALSAPLLVGSALAVLAADRGGPPMFDLGLALVGGQILGFTLAFVARRRLDEPGAIVAVLIVLLLVIVPMIGIVGRHVQTIPAIGGHSTSLPSNVTWALVIGVCLLELTATGSVRSVR
jgi:hypothetical protein